jgi:hypothetical protein
MNIIEFPLSSERMNRSFRLLYESKIKKIRLISVYSVASVAAILAFVYAGGDAVFPQYARYFPLFVKVLSGVLSFGIWWALLTFFWNYLVNREAVRTALLWDKATGGGTIGRIDGDSFEIHWKSSVARLPLSEVKGVLADDDVLIVEMNDRWGGQFFYLPNIPEVLALLANARKEG